MSKFCRKLPDEHALEYIELCEHGQALLEKSRAAETIDFVNFEGRYLLPTVLEFEFRSHLISCDRNGRAAERKSK